MRVTLIALAMLMLASCTDDIGEPGAATTTTYTPVLMKTSDLEKSVKPSEARSLKRPGKIYAYQNYILISERYKGVHIIDNTNPEAPVNMKFIEVPGCLDMAVKGNIMYVDNAVDMVCIDISDLQNVKEVKRIKNVFPELIPPDMVSFPKDFTADKRPANTVIIDWTN